MDIVDFKPLAPNLYVWNVTNNGDIIWTWCESHHKCLLGWVLRIFASFIINVKAKSVWGVINNVESIIKYKGSIYLEVLSINCLSTFIQHKSELHNQLHFGATTVQSASLPVIFIMLQVYLTLAAKLWLPQHHRYTGAAQSHLNYPQAEQNALQEPLPCWSYLPYMTCSSIQVCNCVGPPLPSCWLLSK